MSQLVLVKAALLRAAGQAEAYAGSLSSLRAHVGEAISAVSGEIGGSASGADRQVVAELHAAWAALDAVIATARQAAVEGNRYAASL